MADTQVGYFFHNLQTLCAIGLLKQREKSTLRVQQGERERETLLMNTVLSLMALQIEFGWTASEWGGNSRRWVLHHDPGEARLCHRWVVDSRSCCGTPGSHRAGCNDNDGKS